MFLLQGLFNLGLPFRGNLAARPADPFGIVILGGKPFQGRHQTAGAFGDFVLADRDGQAVGDVNEGRGHGRRRDGRAARDLVSSSIARFSDRAPAPALPALSALFFLRFPSGDIFLKRAGGGSFVGNFTHLELSSIGVAFRGFDVGRSFSSLHSLRMTEESENLRD